MIEKEKQEVRIALTYPYNKGDHTGCNPPLSILYLAATLQQAGHHVLVIDRDEDNSSDSDMLKRLIEYSPDLIGIPLFSNTMPAAYKLVNLLTSKESDWKIVIGGPHATAMPGEVLEVFKGCNYVLRGESEDSIVELVKCIERHNNFETVHGLSYRHNGDVIHNPDVILNKDVDNIPFPARELLSTAYKKKTYWRMGHRGITDIIISSRGCPFNCSFCFRSAKKYRARSPENILEELILLKSQGIKNVHIVDDLFVFNKPRCLKTLAMIKEQKLNMEFKVRARVDTINEELLIAMKEAGVQAITYGFETGSQKMLDLMNKRTTVEKNYKAVALTKKAGIQCYADILIGYPGETPETMKETERFLLKAKPTAVLFHVMSPMPNTKAYDEAKKQGTLIGDWDVNGTWPWIKLSWAEDMKTLVVYQKRIQKKYLSNPIVMFNVLRFIVLRINLRDIRVLLRYFLKSIFLK